MWTVVSLVLGVIGLLTLPANSSIGLLILMIGALAFIRGNRLAAKKREEQRHRELLEAVQKSKG